MKRLLQAWGGTLLGTLAGLLNAIIVTRRWDPAEVADFFLVPVIMIALATISEFGLGVLAVHDVARIDAENDRQAYTNAVLATSARRAVPAGVIAGVVTFTAVDLDAASAVAVGVATILTALAIAGQPLLRGLDRRALASVAGPIAATLLTALALVGVVVARPSVDPLWCALAGYSLAGAATVAVLVRPTNGQLDNRLLHAARSRFAAGHNVANMAGRQVDTLLAGWFMTDALFTGYAVTIRMAAPLGLIAFAGNQAVARDMHQIVDHDDHAIGRARPIYRLTTIAATLGAVGLVAFGSPAGRLVFGDDVVIRVGVLAIVAGGYFIAVLGGPASMLLAAGDRTRALLVASITALAVACVVVVALVAVGLSEWAAPAFVAAWLGVNTTLAARAARAELDVSAWTASFGKRARLSRSSAN